MYRDPPTDIQINVQIAMKDITKYLSQSSDSFPVRNAIRLKDDWLLQLGETTNNFYLGWYGRSDYYDEFPEHEEKYFPSLMDAVEYCFSAGLFDIKNF